MDTAEETWEAVKVVADEVLQRFGQFGEERKAWNGRSKEGGGKRKRRKKGGKKGVNWEEKKRMKREENDEKRRKG